MCIALARMKHANVIKCCSGSFAITFVCVISVCSRFVGSCASTVVMLHCCCSVVSRLNENASKNRIDIFQDALHMFAPQSFLVRAEPLFF